MNVSFQWPAVPEIYFGAGSLSNLPLLISRFGTNALLILGSRSFQGSSHFATLEIALEQHSISFKIFNIAQEPSPQLIDICVSQQSQSTIDVVVAIGGGSVLDAGKAISAMLPLGTSTKSYLEGVGSKQHPGTKVPFIAIPTT
ncbi:MAG TPA: iron-containing alcohol dehydrogenase, partial [Cytophagales bacterium]|nr:iron-containing alcohol dehydrogenase [Cytophagales bacterium]